MGTTHTQPVDFIAELRLRQWARTNYVAAEHRIDSQWHPIVLDEMRRKDTDLSMNQRVNPQLAPRDSNPANRRIDGSHDPRAAPHVSATDSSHSMPIPFYA